MLKKRISKIVFALACIISIVMPYGMPVFAAISHEDTSVNLTVVRPREGGDESSGTLGSEYIDYYDDNSYQYAIADTTVFKIIEEGDMDYSNAIYCLDAEKSFPGIVSGDQQYIHFTNAGDLKDDQNSSVVALELSRENYNALIWLVDNMYLRKQTPELKDKFLSQAFKSQIQNGTTLDEIKVNITDDDIEVVQQWAMWSFTNSETAKYLSMGGVELTDFFRDLTGNYYQVTGNSRRQQYVTDLFNYLVTSAKAGTQITDVVPTLDKTTAKQVVTDANYYIVGPFRVNSGTIAPDVKVKLDGSYISRSNYKLLLENQTIFVDDSTPISDLVDVNYYVCIPKTESFRSFKLELNYPVYETKASIWTAANVVYQPVTVITREQVNVSDEIEVLNRQNDLALRKFIVAKNGKAINERTPDINLEDLASGEKSTAEYKHKKSPVDVEVGDKLTFRIAVYNEGEDSATANMIVDYLPEGLELTENSSVNGDKWTYNEESSKNGYKCYTTTALSSTSINGFDGTHLASAYVDIECTVVDAGKAGKVLTNVAEIVEDNINDRDSHENSINIENIDSETFSGNRNNDTDLSKDIYYEGLEDDDDFEKVLVKGETFDLNLKKFISKVNGQAPETSREPVVDVSPLKNGENNAKYTTTKEPLTVKQGDIITYTIRVYNEGSMDAYAEQVTDFLPEGVGLLVNHVNNIDNYWKLGDNPKTVKLESIPNAMNNLTLDDFTGETDLKNVTVVYGSAVTSTKLKSSDTDTKNLITGFDVKNGTKLAYKDIQVTCVVIDAVAANNNYKNIAEVTVHSDKDRDTTVPDRDSTPGTVNPDNYPGDDKNQDDNDYELVKTEEPKKFDLSLQKVIAKLNGTDVDRKLTVAKDNKGKIVLTHTTEPLAVSNGDLVTYRLIVFNEGEVAGYAEEIFDDIPDGLEFVSSDETNKKYGWVMYDKNGNQTNDVAQAKSVRTTYLSRESSQDNLIKAFNDPSISTVYTDVGRLDFKYVEVVFKVIASDKTTDLVNIAEIYDDADEDGNPVKDEDSTPGNQKDGEDDQDKEKVRLKEFDLSLQKFISKVNNNGVNREPTLSKDNNGKVVYTTTKDPLAVADGDTVTYTIRVYNEGDIAGYAKEVSDNIPEGLEFVTDDNTNKQYRWKMYDANGAETTDPAKAKSVKTDYLSRDVNPNLVIKAFDKTANISSTNPAHQDLLIVFKVKESAVKDAERKIKNIAEITDDTDDKGNPVTDIDSIPGNNKDGEDDQDDETIVVSYFDLSLQKDLAKIVVIENGNTKEIAANNSLMKVEINRKRINTTTVKFVYNIVVKNEGQRAGYATEITDYIPDGLTFVQADNAQWSQAGNNIVKTTALKDTLIKPGETATVQITLQWANSESNMGQKINTAEISDDADENHNPVNDVDSTPNNRIATEDDIDTAPVILSISTGSEKQYVLVGISFMAIITAGVVLIKKFVL